MAKDECFQPGHTGGEKLASFAREGISHHVHGSKQHHDQDRRYNGISLHSCVFF